MAYRKVDEASLTSVADAIRAKGGTSAKLSFPTGFANAISAIQTGGNGITPTGTITITENGTHDVANYANANVALPEAEQATPSITVSSGGLITATAGDKSATLQMTTASGKTVIPGASYQTAVAKNVYTTGTIQVKGDTNLKAENIKKGVSIFNVTGTFEGGGLPSGISAIATGTVTPTEDATNYLEITHNLGVTPNFLVWMITEDFSTTPGTSMAILGAQFEKKFKYNTSSSSVHNHNYCIWGYSSSSQLAYSASRVSNTGYMTDTTCWMKCNSTYPIKKGYTYRWVCGIIDGIL